MLVTGVAGTTWTVTRGIEGTSAASHAAGTAVVAVLTAGALDELRAEIESEFSTVVYYPTGTGDQTRLNSLMSISASRSQHVLVASGSFNCDVDAVIPSNTTLTYSPGVTITGTRVPFHFGLPVTTVLGTMTINARYSRTIASSVSIPTGTLIGLELASGVPGNNDLTRFQFTVLSCTGASAPYTVTLDRPLWVVLPTGSNIVSITSQKTNIHIDCGGCLVQTAQHAIGYYAKNCSIKNYVGTLAGGTNLFVGCRDITVESIDDSMMFFLCSCDNCHVYRSHMHDVAGAAAIMDDCRGCTFEDCNFTDCINGGIMGTNRVSEAGADSGGWGSSFIRCHAVNCSTDGFSIQNSCTACSNIDCTSELSGSSGIEITTGWVGVGPKDCVLTNLRVSGPAGVALRSADVGNRLTINNLNTDASREGIIFTGSLLVNGWHHYTNDANPVVAELAGAGEITLNNIDVVGIGTGNTALQVSSTGRTSISGTMNVAVVALANKAAGLLYLHDFKLLAATYGLSAEAGTTIFGPNCDLNICSVAYLAIVPGAIVRMVQTGGVALVTSQRSLTFTENYCTRIEVSGAQLTDIAVTVEQLIGNTYLVSNGTSGGHLVVALTNKAGDTGIPIAAGKSAIVQVNSAGNMTRVTADA
jgi:hypothetical protein